MNLSAAQASSDALLSALQAASVMDDPSERLKNVNDAWRVHGVPLQEAFRQHEYVDLDGEWREASKIFRVMLGSFGQASMEAMRFSAMKRQAMRARGGPLQPQTH